MHEKSVSAYVVLEAFRLQYKVTVIGYPATFINWKTAEASDYEWIRMEKTLTTADKDKIAAVIK